MERKIYKLPNSDNKVPTNYIYNLLSSLLLIDINVSDDKKDCKVCYVDQSICVCDRDDIFFTNDKSSPFRASIKDCRFYPFIDFVTNYDLDTDSKTKSQFYYNPYCAVLYLSYDTIQKYLVDNRIMELSIDDHYDIIAKKITELQLLAQEELLTYLNYYRENNKMSFGELYDRMICSMVDPLSDRFYDKMMSTKSNKVYLIGNMNTIYQSYVLDNMVLSVIYLDMVYKFMTNDKGIYYNQLFCNLGRNPYAHLSNFNSYESVAKSIYYNLSNKNTPKREIKASRDYMFAPMVETIVSSNKLVYGYVGRRNLGEVFISPFASNGADLFFSNSICNIASTYWIINKIHSLLKEDKSYTNCYHNYCIYMPKIQTLTQSSINKKDSMLTRILVNQSIYEYITRDIDKQIKNNKFSYMYSYGELAMYPSIDPASSALIDFDELPLHVIKDTTNDASFTSCLGNSVFKGHIQSHVSGVHYNDRHQYMAPIWLRPLYERELFVKYGIQSHKIIKYAKSNNTIRSINFEDPSHNKDNRSFLLNLNNNNRLHFIDSLNPIDRLNHKDRVMSSIDNQDIDDNLHIMRCSISTMMCVRCYMISIIHMIASDSKFQYIVSAPTKNETILFKKDFSATSTKTANILFKDFVKLNGVDLTIGLTDVDTNKINNGFYNNVCYVLPLSCNNIIPSKIFHNYKRICKMMSTNSTATKADRHSNIIKCNVFNALSATYIHDSLRISREQIEVLNVIVRGDMFGGVI